MPDELPEGYYLNNFHFLLDFVSKQYAHLLHDTEIAYTTDFQHLQLQSQMLYVRLIQRRGPLFRCDKLVYAEVPDLDVAIAELTSNGFLDDGNDAEILDKLNLLTKKELLDLPETSGLDRSARKMTLIEELMCCEVEIAGFELVRPLQGELLQLYKLLFFGNLNQDFTEFVLNDLGVTPFEDYSLENATSFFKSREIVDQLMSLNELSEESYAVIEEGDQSLITQFVETLPKRSSDPNLARRYDRILNRLAMQYERLGELDRAMALYSETRLPPSRERQARILQKQDRVQMCTQQCLKIINKPVHDEEYEFAVRFLARHVKKHPDQTPMPALDAGVLDFQPITREILTVGDPLKRVEEIACDWFEAQGQSAIYVENSLLPGLFGLAFWDIIFAPVAGAFFNPFQRGPTDMFTPEFYYSRRAAIEKRMLELLDKDNLRRRVTEQFQISSPKANYFVQWSWLTHELLDRILAMISAKALTSVFRRLINDPANNRSGFPDLIVFEDDRYSLVEIKGPGDRLQNNQLRWLRHFDSVGIPAEVVHVSFAALEDA